MLFSRQARWGWLRVPRGTVSTLAKPFRVHTCCVRFASGRLGLPHLPAGTRDLPRQRKFATLQVSGFPPGSEIRRAGLPRTSEEPYATDALHNCGPRTFSRESTALLRATTPPALAGESACRSTARP